MNWFYIFGKSICWGGDNACGAIGAGIINDNDTLCSIGTSGVIVNVEKVIKRTIKIIYIFDHSVPNTYYAMGVTWLQDIVLIG